MVLWARRLGPLSHLPWTSNNLSLTLDAHQQGRAPAQHHDSYALQQAVVASNDANVLSRLLPNQFSP